MRKILYFISIFTILLDAKVSPQDLKVNYEDTLYFGNIRAKLISFGGYNTPECKLAISEDGKYFYLKKVHSTCKKFTNTKGVKIICNSNKSVCKTRAELIDFVKGGSDRDYDKPSWCSKSNLTPIERTICSNRGLSRLDLELSKLYEDSNINTKSQLDWLRNRRDRCNQNVKCIKEAYIDRIAFLKSMNSLDNSYTVKREPKSEKREFLYNNNKSQRVSLNTPKKTLPPKVEPIKKESKKKKPSNGTGFFVDNEYVITNYHVVKNCKNIILNKIAFRANAEVLSVDKYNDLALLRSSKSNPIFLKIENPPRAKLGEGVIIIGYPMGNLLGRNIKLSTGIVSGVSGVNNDTTKFQFTAPIQKGNSGGPVLNYKGGVVGVVYAKVNVADNVGLAMKGYILNEFLNSNDVLYTNNDNKEKLDASEVADLTKKAIVQVICK